MQAEQRAGKALRRLPDRTSGAGDGARRRRARVRQVVVDLPPHALDLLIDLCGELLMSCRSHLLRLVRQHRQRRLQAMRQVAGFCDGARYAPLALLE
jgi:hypothetical protein